MKKLARVYGGVKLGIGIILLTLASPIDCNDFLGWKESGWSVFRGYVSCLFIIACGILWLVQAQRNFVPLKIRATKDRGLREPGNFVPLGQGSARAGVAANPMAQFAQASPAPASDGRFPCPTCKVMMLGQVCSSCGATANAWDQFGH
jgi:hypothetical protein